MQASQDKRTDPWPLFESCPEKYRVTWLFALPLLVLACFILGQMIAVIPVVELGLIARDAFESYPNILYMLVAPFIAIGSLVWLWVRYFERRSRASLGLAFDSGTPKNIALGYLTGIGMSTVIVACISFAGGFEQSSRESIQNGSFLPALFLFLTFSVQSSTEEIIFRGYLFSRFSERYGLLFGVISNSILFTLLHLLAFDFDNASLSSLIQFSLMTFVFSVYLSLTVVRRGTVWFACAWHAGWNWFFICGFGLPTTGIDLDIRPLLIDLQAAAQAPVWLTGGTGGPEDSAFTAILLTVACIVGIYRLISDRVDSTRRLS